MQLLLFQHEVDSIILIINSLKFNEFSKTFWSSPLVAFFCNVFDAKNTGTYFNVDVAVKLVKEKWVIRYCTLIHNLMFYIAPSCFIVIDCK